WGDGHANFISHHVDEARRTERGLVCDHVNKHETHTQLLMATDADAVVVVAPPAVDFSAPDDVESIRAFLVRPYQPFVLARSTWHWGPFPVGADRVRLFNIQGRRYAEDNVVARLVDLEITLSS